MRNRFIFSLLLTIFNLSFSLGQVLSPPYIVKQPPADEVPIKVETNAETDRSFYLECKAIGEPTPRYHWVKNGEPFNWQDYEGRISQQPGRGTLLISKPEDVDVGQYQCFAENDYGVATSNSVFLRKAELNSFENIEATTRRGAEGEPFKLECQPPDGWPKPIVYWIYLYDNGSFKTINNSRITVDPEGNLWFSNLTKADASDKFRYACAIASPFLYVYKLGNRISLDIESVGVSSKQNRHPPVRQFTSRKNKIGFRGKEEKFHCIFGGTPLPQTVWLKDGKPIEPSDRIILTNYGKSLVIKEVDFGDEGNYICEVSNGVTESYSMSLRVYAVPYFTVEPERLDKAEGETAEFRCEVSGVPRPEIKWIHNGKPISEATPNPRRRVESNRIIIERLTRNDTGNYGCNATNSLGYAYKDVYVNVLSLSS